MKFSSPVLEEAGESLQHRVLLACKRGGISYTEASAATSSSPDVTRNYLVNL